MVSGNPFLDDDDVDENDLDLSLGLQNLHVSSNQNIDDKVAGGFGFDLDDDVDDDEDDLALPSLDDYDDELLPEDQTVSNFSSTVETDHNPDGILPVDSHSRIQDDSSVSTDVDTGTEDEILFDDDGDSAGFEDGLNPDADSGESESSQISDESHGSIIYGDFDDDDDEFIFDDDEDEDDLYDFDSPDSTDFLTNDSSDRDRTGPVVIADSDQDNNSKDDEQTSDSDTPDDSVNDSEGSSDSKTGDDTKSGDSSFVERLKAFASGLGERVSSVVTDIKNDLRGHDGEIPDSSSDEEDENNPDPEEKSNDNNKSKKPESRKGKSSSNPLKSLLSSISGFYNKIVGIFFKILTSVLGVLAGIPVIGRPFKIALAATRILEIIAKSAPALLLVAGLVTMSWMSVPGSTTTELPDEGKVEFSSFSYSNGGTALGVMKNTGEVSVEGQAQFTVYSLQPGWNPKSWFIYQAEKTCESNVVTVDIESQTEVSASCGQASGWLPRVSGTIK